MQQDAISVCPDRVNDVPTHNKHVRLVALLFIEQSTDFFSVDISLLKTSFTSMQNLSSAEKNIANSAV